jgi:4-aminobutyrate aminotransferase/(S)-3-amino-2-methylpropionate transaminase
MKRAIKTPNRQISPAFKLTESPLYSWILKHEPRSTASTIPLTWAKAKDFSVWDDKGNKFIDLTSGIFVANAGHANPKIIQAIKKQLDSALVFSYNYPTRIKERLIQKLFSLSPKHFNTVTLLNSGSEAMDVVYKLIKLYGNQTGKKYIITFSGNYHGRGLSNDLISGSKQKASWSGVSDEAVVFLDFPYEASAQFDPDLLPPADEIAGFVLETFQGWGAWFYPKKFVTDLAAFAKKNGALLAFDEMQAGFYRLGPVYGYMTYGDIQPDIIALGKGITSSLPLSAVLSRKEIFNIDTHADLHGTHSANAVCAAAALSNIEFLSSAKEIARRKKTIPVFEKEMKSLEKLPMVKQVNVRGMIAGIIFNNAEDATAVVMECIQRGVLPVCTNRNSIKISPPLTITTAAIQEAGGVLREAFAAYSAKKNSS